ncbi:DUF3131 domain-containing protein [Azohydromonas caseinilytica]|uniref:DUF3131 domain-containing protein n=1 Tax=Azohydromonas caseinilytica TaxID=2728836 RepID=A0A848FAP8_9BURK|nr:DUF3131 domain-containing protein [Azohydromonas caseinilytica]NML16402.1 DUF3131 domain-containing protein [Azohydromonas caseinilytica]
MSFRRNLVHARSYIITILALLVAFGIVIWMEQRGGWAQASAAVELPDRQLDAAALRASARPLTEQERQWARIAWTYFQNNTDPVTGLAFSVEKFPSATMWDTGSYLMGVISAQRLELIEAREFDERIARALGSLQKLPLFDGKLPNKAYNASTLQMTDYTNQPTERGIGWSAIDIARLMVPLQVLVWQYPQHTQAVRAVLGRLDLSALQAEGEFMGARLDGQGRAELVQEGRLGYEQYASKSLALVGRHAPRAASYTQQLAWSDVEGVRIGHDRRTERESGAHNYVLSEPYVLDGLEMGWDRDSGELGWRVFLAQQRRFEKTGQLTAVTEDHLDQKPYFAYNTVHANGRNWFTLSDTGEDLDALRTLSVKASFGWHALVDNDYTRRLVTAVAPLHDPQRGWYAGLYERTREPNKALTANTNAVVLESLAYIQGGPLVRVR